MAGIIGSLFTSKSIQVWYTTLIRPDIAPPNWVFGPVWTTLYLLMGISSYIIWTKGLKNDNIKVALYIFIGQLALNSLWSIIFFGLNDIRLALIEIFVLWLFILANIILFGRISRLAGMLLVPYLLWVTFASYLNYSFLILNT